MKLLGIIFLTLMQKLAIAQPACPDGRNYPAVVLPGGKIVYKKIIERKPRCMDCNAGVVYLDSTCSSIASFTIGNAVMASVKEGYNINDFKEGRMPVYKAAYERNLNRPAFNFAQPKSFLLKELLLRGLADFETGDSLFFSNQKGLLHYKNGNLVNSYKIIPRQVTVQFTKGPQKTIIYYWDLLKRFFFVKETNGITGFYIFKNETAEHEFPSESKEDDWEKGMIFSKP